MKKVLLASLAILACLAHADPRPEVELRYVMRYGGIPIAEVVDTLRFEQDAYKIESRATPTGLAKALNLPDSDRDSSGLLTAEQVMHSTYYHEERGDRVRGFSLDLSTGKLAWNDDKGNSGTEDVKDLLVDPLTLVYMPYLTGKVVDGTAQYADGRRFYEIDYKVDEPSKLTVEHGEHEVRRMSLETGRKDRERIIWYATELGNLPVKIRVVSGSNVVEFELVSFSELGHNE